MAIARAKSHKAPLAPLGSLCLGKPGIWVITQNFAQLLFEKVEQVVSAIPSLWCSRPARVVDKRRSKNPSQPGLCWWLTAPSST